MEKAITTHFTIFKHDLISMYIEVLNNRLSKNWMNCSTANATRTLVLIVHLKMEWDLFHFKIFNQSQTSSPEMNSISRSIFVISVSLPMSLS